MTKINRYAIFSDGPSYDNCAWDYEVDEYGDWLDREEVLYFLKEVLSDTVRKDKDGNRSMHEIGVMALEILCQKLS